MAWQTETVQLIMDRLPPGARAEVVGSAADPGLLDRWSDVDVHLTLTDDHDLDDLLAGSMVWVITESDDTDSQLLRIVLTDGRRLDLTVHGPGRMTHGHDTAADDPRMLLVLATVKLGRGDRLIGAHLLLEFLQHCLIQVMLLRDRDEGTTVHRHGTARDREATDVAAVLSLPWVVEPDPRVIDAAIALHDRYRSELEPTYRADWSGLIRLLAQASATATPGQGRDS